MDKKIRNIRFFSRKDANLYKRIQHDYIDGDLAIIACKVNGIDDVLCHYSVKGYEIPSSELISFIEEIAEYIPSKYPIVLEITGHSFSEDEQKTIRKAFKSYFAYDLGDAQKNRVKGILGFIGMFILMIITAVVIRSGISSEMILGDFLDIGFWIFADVVYSFILGQGFSNRKARIRAARLESIQVVFEETFDDSAYTREETAKIVENMLHDN